VRQSGRNHPSIQIGRMRIRRHFQTRISPEAEAEFQTGTALTKKSLFREAIPHLLAARILATHEYAANFDLALCYVGTRQFHWRLRF